MTTFSFKKEQTISSSPSLHAESIPFRFKGISPTPFAIAPYDYCFGYSGFPPLFSSPKLYMNLVVECSPSTQVPYDLRNTLGCFTA